ncbi:nucleotidyltransferase domain-containing protein [bacterium]|nr:nucleotidyltransferase domain-containing protein [bacterium]
MVDSSIVGSVKKYLSRLCEEGIPVQFGILFGSYARGKSNQWSDIDLIVVSRKYDGSYSYEDINRLWRTAARTDSRIEPVPCGVEEWEKNDERIIIEMARREGVKIAA